MIVKIKAIWRILTSKCWFVGVSNSGMVGDQVDCFGHYTIGMAEALINKNITDVNEYLEQESALDEVKNILSGIK
jgi:hypothetical protein